jgi:hypothetical protein
MVSFNGFSGFFEIFVMQEPSNPHRNTLADNRFLQNTPKKIQKNGHLMKLLN